MGGRNIADVSREDDEDENMPSRSRQPPPRLDWKKLGQKACVAFRRTPNVDFMYVYPCVLSVDPNQPYAVFHCYLMSPYQTMHMDTS